MEGKRMKQTEIGLIPKGKSRSRKVDKGNFIFSNFVSFEQSYIQIDNCILP